MVGAGAVVTQDVPAGAIVFGNPARIVGYVDTPRTMSLPREARTTGTARRLVTQISVGAVALQRLQCVADLRGSLAAAEHPAHLPFVPVRCFVVFDIPSKEVRGEHAHRSCHQSLICPRGSVSIVVTMDDVERRSRWTAPTSDCTCRP